MPIRTERAGSTSVLVVDDHRTFADLLALALAGQPDLHCVGTAHSAEEGLALALSLQPDVVVVGVRLGSADGLEVTARLTAMSPGLRVIVLTAQATQALLERAVTAGACCLVPKNGSFQEVLSAVRSARRGGFVVHPALMRDISGTRQVTQPAPQLTLRERDVLDLLADGHDARAIARALGISLHICWGHVRSLLTRLNAQSQLQAVANATRVGLVHGADLG